MKISISTISISVARRRLPTLVRQTQRDPTTRIRIAIRNKPVAELRAVEPHPEPGEAGRRLLAVARRLERRGARAKSTRVSEAVKDHLYGRNGITR